MLAFRMDGVVVFRRGRILFVGFYVFGVVGMMLAEGVRDVEGVGEWCTWGAWVPLGLVDGDGGCSYPG